MHIPTLFLDTSVIGGYFDEDWQREPTRELWRQMELGLFRFTSSFITQQELSRAPRHILELFTGTFPTEMIFDLNAETEALTQAYLRQGILPEKFADDARQVAICTVAQSKYLVSWNFKHMVNEHRRDAFNAVNLLQGYRAVRIVSPKELIYDDADPKEI